MKWFKLAWLNVRRNGRRSIITIMITAIGIAAVLIGIGFANFTYVSLQERSAREAGHLQVAHKDFFDKQEETPMQYGLDNYQTLAQKMLQNNQVKYAVEKIQFSGLISNGDKSAVFIGSGINPSAEFKAKGPFLTITSGNTLSTREKADDPKILIGKGLAKIMQAKVGDSLTLMGSTTNGGLNAIDVTVHGITDTGNPEIDKRQIFVNVKVAQDLLQTKKVSLLSLYLYETDKTDLVKKSLQKEKPDFAWQTWLDVAFYYVGVKNLYNRIFGLLGFIIILIVFFSIVNTIGMSVVERTREIGALRALGTYNSEVKFNFMLEGGIIGIIGSIVGAIIALITSLVLLVLDLQMPPPPGSNKGYPLVIDIPAEIYAPIVVISIMLCMIAAFIASSKAVKKPITEALSHT
ncbi:MAG: ABC transporter permease [Gammaproteobacteria bacterium]|nr:MAG: ABC transporter permease [Gammaproteobacteria bacterium]